MDHCTGTAELVDADRFFAPAPYAPVGDLIAQHAAARAKIEAIAGMLDRGGDFADVVGYFISGNVADGGYSRIACERVFRLDGALAALHAAYWQRALELTDVYECMPAARREQWSESVRKHQTPPFSEENVRATLEELLLARGRFLAERVDGIFQKLSRSHVTNTPEGFNRRMILEYVFNTWGHTDHDRASYINDLRCIVAKFMGRDEPKHYSTRQLLDRFRSRTGVWHVLDGGAMRIRVYKKGTAHLEVHPDMAWRLNCILHTLYPAAIAAADREPPTRRTKEWGKPIARPLPFEVIEVIMNRRIAAVGASLYDVTIGYCESVRKQVMDECTEVLVALGGMPQTRGVFRFDYDPSDALVELLASGCIPDRKSHQFYPTPPQIVERVIELADISSRSMRVLEPSAGTGCLARAALPLSDRVTVCEIAPLFAEALATQGYFQLYRGDFLQFARDAAARRIAFDRIIMNPPFADGQAEAHVRAAIDCLALGGKLVAVVPSSHRNKRFDRMFSSATWHDTFDNAFPGASVSVSLLVVERDA